VIEGEAIIMKISTCWLVAVVAGSPVLCLAGQAEDMAEMQRRLNQEVMSQPFDAGDVGKADAYAEEAMKKHLKPAAKVPSYWEPGWSCADMTRSPYYSYRDYRDCVYYHRYYNRYW
jgi:hypothetical protein